MRLSGEGSAAPGLGTEQAGGWRNPAPGPVTAGEPGGLPAWSAPGRWMPPAALVETRANVFLVLELPGVETKDLDISLQEQTVVIRGQKPAVTAGEMAVHFSELDSGAFERRIQLPAAAAPDTLMATLVRGVLVLTILKREEEAAHGEQSGAHAGPEVTAPRGTAGNA